MCAKKNNRLEYILLILVGKLVRLLPLRGALALGWVVAAATHFIVRVNVKRTHQRIRQVLGEDTPAKKIRKTAWISWRNLFFNAIEALRFPLLTPKKIAKHPMASLVPTLKNILKKQKGKGFILATPHMGSWEIAGVAADLSNIPIFAIARKQKNPLVDKYINQMRQSFSLEILFKHRQIGKAVIDRINQGKILAILPDIQVRRNGVTVDFLNGQATIAPGTAHFAQLTNSPIYPAVMRREGWTQHAVTLLDPIYPDPNTTDKKEDQQRMMKELMAGLSTEILKNPEQYFWYNKRWVVSPSEKDKKDPQQAGR